MRWRHPTNRVVPNTLGGRYPQLRRMRSSDPTVRRRRHSLKGDQIFALILVITLLAVIATLLYSVTTYSSSSSSGKTSTYNLALGSLAGELERGVGFYPEGLPEGRL